MTPTETESDRPVLFLSHAAMDKETAHYIKETIQHAFSDLYVFVSSDPEDLPIGDPWVDRILDALERAKLIAVLTTERGLSRKWVWFEAGAGWERRRKIVSCCVGTVRKSALPAPFNMHTAVNIDEADGLRDFLDLLAKEFGEASGQVDHPQWISSLTRLDIRAEEHHKRSMLDAEKKPFLDDRKQALQRKLHDLDQAERDLLRFVMIYGEVDNRRIHAAWRRGYEVQHTITRILNSGLVQKRIERAGSMEIAWHLSINAELKGLLETMLFPSDEQESNPYFQI